MKIVNLTPHTINVQVGETRLSFPSEGNCRVIVKQEPLWEVEIGDFKIPRFSNNYGPVEGLPDPVEGTVYVVSLMVVNALKDRGLLDYRRDVVSPDSGPTAIRENGQIVAVRGFINA